MAHIETISESSAVGATAEHYAKARRDDGRVANHVLAFGHRPEYAEAWAALLAAVKKNMDPRRYELATLAAALALGSSYCALAHGSVLLRDHVTAEELGAIARDFRAAGLDPVDVAVMEYARKIARDASAVTESDVAKLRRAGLSEGEICDVAAAASARCFFAKYLDAVGAVPDASYAGMDPALRDALTVGRAIELPPDSEA